MAVQKKEAVSKEAPEVEAQEVHEVEEGSDVPFEPVTDDILVLNERLGHPIGEAEEEPAPEPKS